MVGRVVWRPQYMRQKKELCMLIEQRALRVPALSRVHGPNSPSSHANKAQNNKGTLPLADHTSSHVRRTIREREITGLIPHTRKHKESQMS